MYVTFYVTFGRHLQRSNVFASFVVFFKGGCVTQHADNQGISDTRLGRNTIRLFAGTTCYCFLRPIRIDLALLIADAKVLNLMQTSMLPKVVADALAEIYRGKYG